MDDFSLLLLASLLRLLVDFVVLLALDFVDTLVLLLLVKQKRLHARQLLVARAHLLHAELVHRQVAVLLSLHALLFHVTLVENLDETALRHTYDVDFLFHISCRLEFGGKVRGSHTQLVRRRILKGELRFLAIFEHNSVPETDVMLRVFIRNLSFSRIEPNATFRSIRSLWAFGSAADTFV